MFAFHLQIKASRSAPGRIRTCDRRIRSPLLCPLSYGRLRRAGEGNRTPIASLEGWSSAIELHPRVLSRSRGERI